MVEGLLTVKYLTFMEYKISNKMLAECLGAFWLVLGGCGTALFGHVGFLGVALAFGLTVVTMVYGIGHVSGAHLNPAVSFGMWVNGRMNFREMLLYWMSQVVGAIIAGAVLLAVWRSAGLGQTGVFAANGYGIEFQVACGGPETGYMAIPTSCAFLVEALLTFVFLMVVLGVTDAHNASGKFAGLAIGLTFTLVHLVGITLTNTGVNPARSISQALLSDCGDAWNACSQLWLFVAAPLPGAAVAGLFYKCIAPKKKA